MNSLAYYTAPEMADLIRTLDTVEFNLDGYLVRLPSGRVYAWNEAEQRWYFEEL